MENYRVVQSSMTGNIPLVTPDRMGIDPAPSGAMVLTTVTGVVGFLSFPGLATLFIL